MKVDLSLAIGGAQGSGVETAGRVAILAFAMKGLEVFGSREYHSNIVGAHSYYHIRVGKNALRLPFDAVVAMDAESVFTLATNLRRDGLLICNSETLETTLNEIPSMSRWLKKRIAERFGAGVKAGEILSHLKVFAFELKDALRRLNISKSKVSISRIVNIIGVSAMLYLLGVDEETIKRAVETRVSGDLNLRAVELAVEEAKDFRELELLEGNRGGYLMSGNEVVATAKIFAGLEFLSYYPITPATDEALFIEENGDAVAIQAEDEISAIGMALGASISGLRACVTTSGPGFSLMNEMISFAVQAEIPIVITLWMRVSPSTGMATRTSQQDLFHAIFSGHGDTGKIVIASGDHREAFEDVFRAFEFAEKFQIPVIHLLDKFLASSIAMFEKNTFLREKPGKTFSDSELRYLITEDGISPFVPLGSRTMIISGLEHDEYGFATEDPVMREKMMLKRERKLKTIAKSLSDESFVVYGDEDAEITVVSFGSTKNAILNAIETMKDVKFVQLRILSPFPDISKVVSDKVLCIESNLGQLSFLLRTCCKVDAVAKKLNGRPIYENEVEKAIKAVKNGEKEVILSEGI
ncbi:MAG: 2-oxoacid:acceptor oxidoreductase family protein [Archaeoglobaceae archaeon]